MWLEKVVILMNSSSSAERRGPQTSARLTSQPMSTGLIGQPDAEQHRYAVGVA